ncbi:MAG: hypothetical protein AAFV29_22625, partial [Myxococcota bacterium]
MPKHAGCVDAGHEALRGRLVVGHDGGGVARAVLVDVVHRLREAIDGSNGQHEAQKLGIPVFGLGGFASNADRVEGGAGAAVGLERHADKVVPLLAQLGPRLAELNVTLKADGRARAAL